MVHYAHMHHHSFIRYFNLYFEDCSLFASLLLLDSKIRSNISIFRLNVREPAGFLRKTEVYNTMNRDIASNLMLRSLSTQTHISEISHHRHQQQSPSLPSAQVFSHRHHAHHCHRSHCYPHYRCR
jgi:hypothetical protein